MPARAELPEDVRAVYDEVVDAWGSASGDVEGPLLEAYAGQVARLRDAQRRLQKEGLVIADPKGNPIPHPAIMIERDAQAQLRSWGDRFKAPGPGF